jgi:hypothetical protein
MSLSLPGTRGLFLVLQEALRHQSSDGKRLRLRRPVYDFLDNFRWLAKEVGSCPTSIDNIVAQPPTTFRATDASGLGMGGVFFLPSRRPYLWRRAFPHQLFSELVTSENTTGSVSIRDLESAATVAQSDILCQLVVFTGRTTTPLTTTWPRSGGARKDPLPPRVPPPTSSGCRQSTSGTIDTCLNKILYRARSISWRTSPPGPRNFLTPPCFPFSIFVFLRLNPGCYAPFARKSVTR